MKIYNRWGIEVFSTIDKTVMWDGKDKAGNLVTPGAYVYIVNGNGPKKKNLLIKGTVTIIK
jgi:hypothetical protein